MVITEMSFNHKYDCMFAFHMSLPCNAKWCLKCVIINVEHVQIQFYLFFQ